MVFEPKPGGDSLLCLKPQWGFSGPHQSQEVPPRQLTYCFSKKKTIPYSNPTSLGDF